MKRKVKKTGKKAAICMERQARERCPEGGTGHRVPLRPNLINTNQKQ